MGVVIESDRWSIGSVLPSAGGPGAVRPILTATGIDAGYGARPVLHGVDLAVVPGEVVALLGANGSGRTTTLRVLAGQLVPRSGSVTFRGRAAPTTAERRSAAGFATVTDAPIHPSLTVHDHLRLGGGDPAIGYERLPGLRARRRRPAGELGPGEQRLLAVVAALGRRPSILLVDELSRGCRPGEVDEALLIIREAADDGLAVVLAEQHVRRSFLVADQVVVLRRGKVAFCGTAEEAHRRIAEIETEYLFG